MVHKVHQDLPAPSFVRRAGNISAHRTVNRPHAQAALRQSPLQGGQCDSGRRRVHMRALSHDLGLCKTRGRDGIERRRQIPIHESESGIAEVFSHKGPFPGKSLPSPRISRTFSSTWRTSKW